jgi:hypothetical protein
MPISACAFCALVFAGRISRFWRRVRGREHPEERDFGQGKVKVVEMEWRCLREGKRQPRLPETCVRRTLLSPPSADL